MADSLEFLTLASALTEALHIHRSGIEDYLLARRSLADWVEIAGTSLARYSAEVTFLTSGSTGTPKPCTHYTANLLEEADHLTALFNGRQRIIAAVPCNHIYGFIFTVLLPARLDIPVVDLAARSPLGLSSILRSGDLIVAYPEFWRAMTRSMPGFPPDVVGVTSTGACPGEVQQTLLRRGLRDLFEIYGSSETAGVGWRNSETSEFALFNFWSRSADMAELARSSPDGVSLCVEPPDNINWTGPRSFFVEGRLDGAVQVGGINVHPSRIAAALEAHPDVATASVRLMRPEEGARLKAFVVPRDRDMDLVTLKDELFRWMAARLSTAEQPKAITFGDTVPRAAMGKSADWVIDGSLKVPRP